MSSSSFQFSECLSRIRVILPASHHYLVANIDLHIQWAPLWQRDAYNVSFNEHKKGKRGTSAKSMCCVLGIRNPCWSKFAIFLSSKRGFVELPEKELMCILVQQDINLNSVPSSSSATECKFFSPPEWIPFINSKAWVWRIVQETYSSLK